MEWVIIINITIYMQASFWNVAESDKLLRDSIICGSIVRYIGDVHILISE